MKTAHSSSEDSTTVRRARKGAENRHIINIPYNKGPIKQAKKKACRVRIKPCKPQHKYSSVCFSLNCRRPDGAGKMKTAHSSSEDSTMVRRARKGAENRHTIIIPHKRLNKAHTEK